MLEGREKVELLNAETEKVSINRPVRSKISNEVNSEDRFSIENNFPYWVIKNDSELLGNGIELVAAIFTTTEFVALGTPPLNITKAVFSTESPVVNPCLTPAEKYK